MNNKEKILINNKYELIEIIKDGNTDLSLLDTSLITDMEELFKDYDFSKMKGSISNWNVSNVTNMTNMFAGSKNFNENLNEWNVSNLYKADGMFYLCTDFNKPLNKWNLKNIISINGMFEQASSFNQDLSKWKLSYEVKHENVFSGCPIENKYKPSIKLS